MGECVDSQKLEQLELKAAELQNEIRKIQIELQKNKRREEDYRLNQKWREEGLLPEDWCIHKVVLGRRVFFVICDVPDFRNDVDDISLRFYTPDCFSEHNCDGYIRNVLQSIQILRSGSPKDAKEGGKRGGNTGRNHRQGR